MPAWAWVLTVFATFFGLALLALALFRFRYFLEWRGSWDGTFSGHAGGSARFSFGFPGFMREYTPPADANASIAELLGEEDETNEEGEEQEEQKAPEATTSEASVTSGGSATSDAPRARTFEGAPRDAESTPAAKPPHPSQDGKTRNRNRARRALFRLFTDPAAWKLLGRFGLKTARLVLGALRPRIEVAVGHPDPVWLGRFSGTWYTVRPFLPFGRRTQVYFRFQDRSPSLWVRVQGSFSALTILGLGLRLLIAFPSLRLARRALRSWRRHHLTGWRLWVYRRLQALS